MIGKIMAGEKYHSRKKSWQEEDIMKKIIVERKYYDRKMIMAGGRYYGEKKTLRE